MTINNIFTSHLITPGHQPGHFLNIRGCQKPNTIGVVVPELDSYFTISALKGIKEAVGGQAYELIVTHSQQNMEKEVANARLLLENSVVGVIASLSASTRQASHFKPFAKAGIPVVFFDRVLENPDSDRIVADNTACGYQATEHLIRQGCKRIAFITCGGEGNENIQRYGGYRAALEEHGIPLIPELVIRGKYDKTPGIYTARRIRYLKPLPDGLFITNDLAAAACMNALKEAGIRVPEDIAIVGFNNDPIGRLVYPALSTVDYPGYEMGKAAALCLVGRLANKQPPAPGKTIIVPSELIVRQSSLKTTAVA